MIPSTCDLYDRFEDEARVIGAQFRDFGGRRAFAGEAVTVKCFEDNSRIKELLDQPGVGKVLLVDGGGSMRCALMGDMIAKAAVKNGWEGVIVHGCVRDVMELARLDLGIKALGTTPRKSTKRGEGSVGIVVGLGGAQIENADYVVADEDGVLILNAAQAATVFDAHGGQQA